jgi:hypothetical protein
VPTVEKKQGFEAMYSFLGFPLGKPCAAGISLFPTNSGGSQCDDGLETEKLQAKRNIAAVPTSSPGLGGGKNLEEEKQGGGGGSSIY